MDLLFGLFMADVHKYRLIFVHGFYILQLFFGGGGKY
jgi:hypothetical protein